MNTLQKIKQGKNNYKVIDFPGTEEKVALVILTSNENAEARLKADEIIISENIQDEEYKSLEYQKQIVYRALRDKDNISKRLATSFEEFTSTLDNVEIQYFMVEYGLLTNESNPFLGSVTEEQFDELKKTLEKMSWRDLNGPSLVALRNFLLTLV